MDNWDCKTIFTLWWIKILVFVIHSYNNCYPIFACLILEWFYHSKYVHCRLTIWEYCYVRQMWVLVIFFEYVDCSRQTHMYSHGMHIGYPNFRTFTFGSLSWVRCWKWFMKSSLDLRYKQVLLCVDITFVIICQTLSWIR